MDMKDVLVKSEGESAPPTGEEGWVERGERGGIK